MSTCSLSTASASGARALWTDTSRVGWRSRSCNPEEARRPGWRRRIRLKGGVVRVFGGCRSGEKVTFVFRVPESDARLQRGSRNDHRVRGPSPQLHAEFCPIRPGTGENDDHPGCRLAPRGELGCRPGGRQDDLQRRFGKPNSGTFGRSPLTKFRLAKDIATCRFWISNGNGGSRRTRKRRRSLDGFLETFESPARIEDIATDMSPAISTPS